MSRSALIVALAIVFASSTVLADERTDRIKKLEQAVADAERNLTALRKDLERAKEPAEYKKAAEPLFSKSTVEVGTEGPIAGPYTHTVVEVIDEDTVLVRVSEANFAPHMVIRGLSTKGMEKGQQYTSEGTWRVVGNQKSSRGTVFAVRPSNKATVKLVRGVSIGPGVGGPGRPGGDK